MTKNNYIMTTIEIPKKTFDLYKSGVRTFIHLPKERETEISHIKFGENIILRNKESKEEYEQMFWFMYSFKEIDRFIFLVFNCEIRSPLFIKRKKWATDQAKTFSGLNTDHFFVSSNYEYCLLNQLEAYSSFMFIIDSRKYLPTFVVFDTHIGKKERQSKEYICVEKLVLKKSENEDLGHWAVWSMFPVGLL